MAYLPEDENLEQQEAGATQEKVIAQESAAPTVGNGSASSAVSGAQAKPSKSGSFTNLMNYVGANAGNDAKMGQAVSNVVKTQADDAAQKTQSFQNNASQQIQQGVTAQQDKSLQQNLVNDPTKVNKEQLNNQLNARYVGPNQADTIQGYGDAAQAYQRVDDRVAQSQGDLNQRTGLLEEAYSRPTYTSGEKRLDSFILGTGEGGKAQLKNIQDTYGGFRSNLNNARAGVDQQIAAANASAAATRQQAQQAIDQAKTRYTGILDSAAAQAAEDNRKRQEQFNAQNAALQEILGYSNDEKVTELIDRGLMSESEAIRLLQGGQIDDAIRSFYTYGGDKAAGDYVSPEQQAQYEALMDLINGTANFDFSRSQVAEPVAVKNLSNLESLLQAADSNIEARRQISLLEEQMRQADAANKQPQPQQQAAGPNSGTVSLPGNDASKLEVDMGQAITDPMEHLKQRESDIKKFLKTGRW